MRWKGFMGSDHSVGDSKPLPTPRFVSHEPKPHTAPHHFGRERVYGSWDTNRNLTLHLIGLGVNVYMVRG